jgi:hypothetical protein
MPSLTDSIAQIKSRAANFVGQATGMVQTKNTKKPHNVPWNNVKSRFFAPMDIDPSR